MFNAIDERVVRFVITHDQARHLATLYGTAMRARALDIVHITNGELNIYLQQFLPTAKHGIIIELCSLANPVSEAIHRGSSYEKG